MAGWEQATAVAAAGPSSYAADVDEAWSIGGKANGGYLLALLGRAAGLAVPAHPHPVATTAHYLASPSAGPVTIEVDVLRQGRGTSQVAATLLQDGARCVVAQLTMSLLAEGEPWWDDAPPVQLPPEEECFLLPSTGPGGVRVGILDQVEERMDPATLDWAVGAPAGEGELRSWLRIPGGEEDPVALLFAVDALPPMTFTLGAYGWVPTLSLTAYLRALPAPGPLRVLQRGSLVDGGRVDETCSVWDSRGRLVAQATQLAGVRVPDAPPAARTG